MKLSCVIEKVLVEISNEFQIFILKIKKVISKKLGVAFLNVLSIYCDPSLERSRQYGSYEGSQCMFWLRNKKNYL